MLNVKNLSLLAKRLHLRDDGFPEITPDEYETVYNEFLKTRLAMDLVKRYGDYAEAYIGFSFYSYIRRLVGGKIQLMEPSIAIEDFSYWENRIRESIRRYTYGLTPAKHEAVVIKSDFNKMVKANANVVVKGYIQYTPINMKMDEYIENNLKNNFKILPSFLRFSGKNVSFLPYARLKTTNKDWYNLEYKKPNWKISITRAKFDYLVISYEFELKSIFFSDNKPPSHVNDTIIKQWLNKFKP